MTIADLTPDEKLALVALLKATVMADGHVSAEEVEELQVVVDELGEAEYQRLLDKVEARIHSDDELRTFLSAITRPGAQEVIYGTIMELAMSDALQTEETELLDWLADLWGIEVSYDEAEIPPN